jgi:hypothetical protein
VGSDVLPFAAFLEPPVQSDGSEKYFMQFVVIMLGDYFAGHIAAILASQV